MSINQKNAGRITVTAAVAITVMMILTSVRVMAGEEYSSGNFVYEVKDNKVVICGYEPTGIYPDRLKTLVIPSWIDGKKVIGVKRGAISDADVIMDNVVCSDHMATVDVTSFNVKRWKGLSITFGKYTKRYINNVLNEYRFLETRSFKVPKGAKYLKVAKDKGLYSKDGKTLFAVPSCMSGKFIVPKKTKRIYQYAFCNSYLKMIKLPKGIKSIGYSALFSEHIEKLTVKVPRKELKRYTKYFRKLQTFPPVKVKRY